MSKQPTLYTFGYLSGCAERTLSELIETKTAVVDIRYKPTSRHWQYCQDVLSRRPGILYYWIEDLGNEHYKEALTGKYSEPRIKLHDAKAGLTQLQAILDHYGRATLMCACASPAPCHRRVVADLAAKRFGVRVIHLASTFDARAQAARASLAQPTLFDDKALLSEGLHPEQQAIERTALEHYRSITQ